jgi:endonuclease-3 related protein
VTAAHPLLEVYRRLYQQYGPQGWWPGDGPLDVVIGAILTQAAAWRNVELALRNLKAADCWSLEAIRRTPLPELAEIIRPSGYFNAKARKLHAFAGHVHRRHGGDLEAFLAQEAAPLRQELLSIHGIGPETADDILLYAAGKASFVIDAYTRRILGRLGLAPADSKPSYHTYQTVFHQHLPPDATLFNEYHALLDRHAKERCGKSPRCAGCCLQEVCATGRGAPAGSSQD